MNRWWVLPVAVVIAAAGPAQAAQSDPLDRVETLVADGRYDEARATLAGLLADDGELTGAARARALLLRASLEPDAGAAEIDYLDVVLGYPTSPDATEALLRLGQSAVAGGDALRAIGYLQRLVRDYPGSPHRATALLWLARAHGAHGDHAARCAALSGALQSARGDAVLTPMILAADAAAPCADLPPAATTELPAAPAAATESAAAALPAMTAPAARSPSPPTPGAGVSRETTASMVQAEPAYAIQTGAFRDRAPAEALAGRLRIAGFEPRIVTVQGSALVRVRVGHFPNGTVAAETAASLRSAGFDTIVVSDVSLESSR